MSKQREIEIEKDGQKATVLKSAVPAWERNGWTVVDDGDSDVEVNLPSYQAVQVVPDPATDTTEE